MRKIFVLRMGHRLHRDFRITTHCALVARALGADGILISGDRDDDIIKKVQRVNENWGGDFKVEYQKDWRKVIEDWKAKGGFVILTTMYGINLPGAIPKIKKAVDKGILIIVGSEKMPGGVFHLADINVAVTNQPHSEVAAIAILLDRIFDGKELGRSFKGSKLKVYPQEIGKKALSV